MKSEKIYFKNLDSIRFIAATMVYLSHGLRPWFSTLVLRKFSYSYFEYRFLKLKSKFID